MKLLVSLQVFALVVLQSLVVFAAPEETLTSELKQQGFVGLTGRDSWPRGQFALTFDDGPHPTFTPKVLTLLKSHHLKATFFVVGQNINRLTYPLIVRMLHEGHQVGSHSYNHDVKMALHGGQNAIEYIRSEHEVTRLLINIALLAGDADDFDRLYEGIFDRKPGKLLTNAALSTQANVFLARYQATLAAYGYVDGREPYPVLFSRPPGGGPYFGQAGEQARQRYDEALRQLGWINVLWHGGCWDPDPAKRADYEHIVSSLVAQSKRGGIIVIHDYVRHDALAAAIGRIAGDSRLSAVLLEPAVVRKYGSSADVVVVTLQQAAGMAGRVEGLDEATERKPVTTEQHVAKATVGPSRDRS